MMLLIWAIGLLNEILFPWIEKYSENREGTELKEPLVNGFYNESPGTCRWWH